LSEASTVKLQEPRLQDRRALPVAGLRRHYTPETMNEIPALWQRLPFGKIPSQLGHMAYGVLFNQSDTTGGFDYLAGVEVSGVSAVLADLTYVKIPAQKYAIFCHRGHVSKLKDTMAAIWHEWLPASQRSVSHPAAGSPQMIEILRRKLRSADGPGRYRGMATAGGLKLPTVFWRPAFCRRSLEYFPKFALCERFDPTLQAR